MPKSTYEEFAKVVESFEPHEIIENFKKMDGSLYKQILSDSKLHTDLKSHKVRLTSQIYKAFKHLLTQRQWNVNTKEAKNELWLLTMDYVNLPDHLYIRSLPRDAFIQVFELTMMAAWQGKTIKNVFTGVERAIADATLASILHSPPRLASYDPSHKNYFDHMSSMSAWLNHTDSDDVELEAEFGRARRTRSRKAFLLEDGAEALKDSKVPEKNKVGKKPEKIVFDLDPDPILRPTLNAKSKDEWAKNWKVPPTHVSKIGVEVGTGSVVGAKNGLEVLPPQDQMTRMPIARNGVGAASKIAPQVISSSQTQNTSVVNYGSGLGGGLKSVPALFSAQPHAANPSTPPNKVQNQDLYSATPVQKLTSKPQAQASSRDPAHQSPMKSYIMDFNGSASTPRPNSNANLKLHGTPKGNQSNSNTPAGYGANSPHLRHHPVQPPPSTPNFNTTYMHSPYSQFQTQSLPGMNTPNPNTQKSISQGKQGVNRFTDFAMLNGVSPINTSHLSTPHADAALMKKIAPAVKEWREKVSDESVKPLDPNAPSPKSVGKTGSGTSQSRKRARRESDVGGRAGSDEGGKEQLK